MLFSGGCAGTAGSDERRRSRASGPYVGAHGAFFSIGACDVYVCDRRGFQSPDPSLVRHRIASYSQQSQRYVKAHDFASVIPHTIEQIPEAKAKFEACMQGLQNLYNDLADNYGIPAEDARYVLPNAAETKIVCTFNARSLYNFFTLRCCNRAQWEIRELAWRMLVQCRQVAPVLFEKAGPDCVARGICKEGKMSCGILPKVKEYQAAGMPVEDLFLFDGAKNALKN